MNDGEIIRMIRSVRGLSQHVAGMEMGITKQAFAKLEKKNFDNRRKISCCFKSI